jgi:uncharacterized linocin/CFP29 family protein
MDHLLRDMAPISDAGWRALEGEAKPRLSTYLAMRKLTDFHGPAGWSYSATNLGRVSAIEAPEGSVEARQRVQLPLVELRAEFEVVRSELDNADRGAEDLDFGDLDGAARRIALSENIAIAHGYVAAGFRGIAEASAHEAIQLENDVERYPNSVAKALDLLRGAGIGGPYGLAIGPAGYTSIVETTEHGGYLLLDHLHQILDGPVVWAPGVEGAIVVSLRGGDFVFDCGQDLSIGYLSHSADKVRLYFEESFSFRVVEPYAAVALRS